MKIKIVQAKLLEILDYLYVDGLFPFSVLTTKDGKLYSSQKEKEGFGYRYAMFLGDYFNEITEEKESVKIDIEKVKKFAGLRKPDELITLQYPSPKAKNKLFIKGGRARDNISVTKVDESETKISIPFKIENKVPYLNKGQVALDTHVTISLATFKEITSYATAHGTEFFKFKIGSDKKLEVRIGDIHDLDDYSIYEPNSQVYNVDGTLDVTFTKGIKEIAKTFTRDVEIHMKSGLPAWFSEVSQNHRFGVLIPPLKEA